MKCILTILLLTLNLYVNSNTNSIKANRLVNTSFNREVLRQTEYMKEYNKVIEFLKINEGFKANIYDDKGYECVGYGQRLKFYKGTIVTPLTESKATEILEISFNDHLKMVKRVYPRLKGNKVLSVAHQSYTIGIGVIQRLHIIHNNQLDTTRLLTIGDKSCRKFEVNLFMR